MEYIAIIWIICAITAGVIGHEKGEGWGSFLGSLILGPLGLILTITSKGNREKCPYCQKLIDNKAIKCPYCQSDLTSKGAEDVNQM